MSVEPGTGDLDAFGQDEGALKLPCGDAAMEIDALLVVALLAAHHQLVAGLGGDRGHLVERHDDAGLGAH